MIKEQIGNRIRKIRKEKEYSQEYVALKLGISQGTYQRIESGNAEKMDIDVILGIAEVLEVDPIDLIFRNEHQIFYNYNQSGTNYNPVFNEFSENLVRMLQMQMEALNMQMKIITDVLQRKK